MSLFAWPWYGGNILGNRDRPVRSPEQSPPWQSPHNEQLLGQRKAQKQRMSYWKQHVSIFLRKSPDRRKVKCLSAELATSGMNCPLWSLYSLEVVARYFRQSKVPSENNERSMETICTAEHLGCCPNLATTHRYKNAEVRGHAPSHRCPIQLPENSGKLKAKHLQWNISVVHP